MRGLEKTAELVELYLVTAATLAGPNAMPSEPLGKKSRGSSRPPAGKKAMAFWEANRVARQLIEWRVASLMRHANAYNGIEFSELLIELYRNPAIAQSWKAAATPEDKEEGEAFEKMCLLIAQDILCSNPDVQFSVTVNPKPLAETSEEDDATPLQKPGAAHHRNRRYTVEHARRKRYERLLQIEERHDCTRTAAVAILSDELDVGARTIWEAVSFCEGEKRAI